MEIDKIKERVQKAFQSSLSEQVNSIYTTEDGSLFIRQDEAHFHISESNALHKADMSNDILEWFEEYEGNNPIPQLRYIKL